MKKENYNTNKYKNVQFLVRTWQLRNQNCIVPYGKVVMNLGVEWMLRNIRIMS